ncbi:putative ankyrin repeat protein B19/B20 [Trichinella spiralis]|uniref:putative ankyrin repeat protein B19/B20 n=1 Tax=Trichinella spiralis TaxID=6334 RepID=UPI0001EFE630|nr:putative ankyrin repeat protein B19/B20 [Trichinella spiralis]
MDEAVANVAMCMNFGVEYGLELNLRNQQVVEKLGQTPKRSKTNDKKTFSRYRYLFITYIDQRCLDGTELRRYPIHLWHFRLLPVEDVTEGSAGKGCRSGCRYSSICIM